MEMYLGITLIVGGLLLILGIIMIVVGIIDDGDMIPVGLALVVCGLFGPVTLPLAIIVVITIAVVYTLSEFEIIKAPNWLEKLDIW